MDPVIELVEAVAVLGRFPALAGATVTVERGEIVLLRGPNGAGKTTLLRLCAGLIGLQRGSGTVLGHDLATDRAAVRAKVGLLGHTNGLYADLTVRENVRFWGSTVGASSEEIEASMTRLGLDGRLATVKVGQLSAGQKRRTALACLVARRAELWLLDEPHAGLDADGRDELDATLRAAVSAGATVVVASHELERTGNLASRVIDVAGGLAQRRFSDQSTDRLGEQSTDRLGEQSADRDGDHDGDYDGHHDIDGACDRHIARSEVER
jgi:heme ABC exporter ATP-binding subunit CcmA